MSEATTRLGFIIPSTNFVVEPDVYTAAPPGVTTHFSRLLIRGRDIADGYPQIWRESNRHLYRAVEELASARVAAIAYAVTAGSFFGGRAWEERVRARIEAERGIPATSTSFAIVQALRTFGASRITVATAYSDLLNARLRRFLQQHEFEVLAIAGLGNTRIQQPASEEPERITKLVARLVTDGTQAIVVSCAGLSALGIIDGLERQHGVPVVSSNQAVLWSAMRAAGVTTPVEGRGSLLRQH